MLNWALGDSKCEEAPRQNRSRSRSRADASKRDLCSPGCELSALGHHMQLPIWEAAVRVLSCGVVLGWG